MTSLNSGLPSLETCFHGPWPVYLPVRASQTWDLRRLALAHTPTTDLPEPTAVGVLPSLVRSRFGTWIAIVCTLNPCTELTPVVSGIEIRCRWLTGRSAPRS